MSALNTVSSDDVIDSYRHQLSEAHHKVAMLEAKVVRLTREVEKSLATGPALMPQPDVIARGQDVPDRGQVEIHPLRS